MVNKADLLTAFLEPEDPAELECLTALSADPSLGSSSLSNEDPNQDLEDNRGSLQLSHGVRCDTRSASTEQHMEVSDTGDSFPYPDVEKGAMGAKRTYDVQPRNLNANLEWMQEQQTRSGAASVLLTSTVTGQGLHELMVAVNRILERKQGCSIGESRASAQDRLTGTERPQKFAIEHTQIRRSMASTAA